MSEYILWGILGALAGVILTLGGIAAWLLITVLNVRWHEVWRSITHRRMYPHG